MYKCSHTNCSKNYKYERGLRKHEDEVHNNTVKCNNCKKEFTSKYLRNEHLKKEQCGFSCSKCKKTFTTEQYRNIHEKKDLCSKKISCKYCNKQFNRYILKERHEERKACQKDDKIECKIIKKVHYCTYCNKEFQRKMNRDRHLNRCSTNHDFYILRVISNIVVIHLVYVDQKNQNIFYVYGIYSNRPNVILLPIVYLNSLFHILFHVFFW